MKLFLTIKVSRTAWTIQSL